MAQVNFEAAFASEHGDPTGDEVLLSFVVTITEEDLEDLEIEPDDANAIRGVAIATAQGFANSWTVSEFREVLALSEIEGEPVDFGQPNNDTARVRWINDDVAEHFDALPHSITEQGHQFTVSLFAAVSY